MPMPRKPREPIQDIPIGAAMPHGKFEKYFGIPDWLFIDKSVGWGAKIVYAVINRFSETWTFPVGGMEFIQEIIGISRAELFKRLNELEEAGFIGRELDKRYKRRIKVIPIHNTVARDFFEDDDGAFERWERFRKTNCLHLETVQKNQQSPNGDLTKVVESPNGDSSRTNLRHYDGSAPYCISELVSEPFKSEKNGCADLSLPISDQNLQNLPEVSLETETLESLTPTPPSPAALEEEKYFESQSTLNLQLDESVDKFIANAYRQSRGAKITKAEIKRYTDKIETTEESLSREEFRTQLWHFLNTPSKWLRENKWPIAAFLKDPLSYTAPVPAYRTSRDASPAPAVHTTSSEVAPNAPVRSATSYLHYVDKWNTIIPEVPCGELPEFVVRQVEKTIQDPEFAAVFDEVIDKCAQIARVGLMVVSFRWLCTSTKDGPTWQQLYMGKYDWATRSRGVQLSAGDQAMEAALREEREAELRGK